jgi:hypothetical protein
MFSKVTLDEFHQAGWEIVKEEIYSKKRNKEIKEIMKRQSKKKGQKVRRAKVALNK